MAILREHGRTEVRQKSQIDKINDVDVGNENEMRKRDYGCGMCPVGLNSYSRRTYGSTMNW